MPVFLYNQYLYAEPGGVAELHQLARRLGIADFRPRVCAPHYIVREEVRRLAVQEGAASVDRAFLKESMRRWRSIILGPYHMSQPDRKERWQFIRPQYHANKGIHYPGGGQCLSVAGKFTGRLPFAYEGIVPAQLPVNSAIYIITDPHTDVPIGTRFEVAYPYGAAEMGEACECYLIKIALQDAMFDEAIPRELGTTSFLQFPSGLPRIIQNLPNVNRWYETKHENCVRISTLENWY